MELEPYLRPLYQDLDGASRVAEVERIAAIARKLYTPPTEETRAFELLLRFHGLGRWLEKMGNVTRTVLAVPGLTEGELRRTAASIARLGEPASPGERAVAAARLIDGAGVRGLTELVAGARREGNSLMDVLRAALSDVAVPDWLPPRAEEWLHRRREARRQACRRLLEELQLEDLT
ncbi:MAG: hypothetical protein ABI779_00890 [Acidobacteriota bacterium]